MQQNEIGCRSCTLKLRVGTFFGFRQLATFRDRDWLLGFVVTTLLHVLYFVYNIIALENFAENNMLSIEPTSPALVSKQIVAAEGYVLGDGSRDEELRAIGVLSRVRHAEKTFLAVLQLEILILELFSVDRLAARTLYLVSDNLKTSELTLPHHPLE